MNHPETLSATVSSLTSALLSALSPKNASSLSPHDMVMVLQSVPRQCRGGVHKALQDFQKDNSKDLAERLSPPLKETKPGSSTGLRRRMKNLSQEQHFTTFDSILAEGMNTATQLAAVRRNASKDKHASKASVDIQKNDRSYSVIHKRRASLRKELDWADIKLAQALAVSKAKGRSPTAKEGGAISKTTEKCRTSAFGASANSTAKSLLASLLAARSQPC